MRKLLMATAAILGATSGLALAQTANPSQGQYVGPYGAGPGANNNLNIWGTANTPSGSAAAGPLSTLYAPNTFALPTPGNVVIRLNGRIEADAAAVYATGMSAAGYKTNPVTFGEWIRLYPGFDGVAANGLHYGASMELRENFASGSFPGALNGTTAPSTSGSAASSSASTSGSTVYVRRAFTYLGADNVGIFRFGSGDGIISIFDPCIFTSGCWDAGSGNFGGGNIQGYGVQAATIPFANLSGQGADYTSTKLVYLSPQFFGFDLGVEYAPGMENGLGAGGTGVSCVAANPQCPNISSGVDGSRWINKVGVGLRYMQAFGPVDVKAYGLYEAAGKESLNGAAFATPALFAAAQRYDNLSFYKFGAAVTTMNLTFAADYIGGAINKQLAERPTGGVNQNAVVLGVTYANGPITAGLAWELIDDQGAQQMTHISQEHEYGITAGGNYKLAPGVQIVAEYMYENRHQGGVDMTTGATKVPTRDAHANLFMLSTVLSW